MLCVYELNFKMNLKFKYNLALYEDTFEYLKEYLMTAVRIQF